MNKTETYESDKIQQAFETGKLIVVEGSGPTTMAHTLLEALVSLCIGQVVEYGSLPRNFRGKPMLSFPHVYFNISHSHEQYVVGICKGAEIGIDMESEIPGKDMGSLAAYAFSPDELELLKQGCSRDTFLRIWTLKEAYLKANGMGLMDNLSGMHVVAGNPMKLVDASYSNKQFIGFQKQTISIVCKGVMPEIIRLRQLSGNAFYLE